MKYSTPRAFRQALETQLRQQYPSSKIPRLRKMITFERFMARLDDDWILKGGYALQLRTDQARTTQDIDLLARKIPPEQLHERLLTEVQRSLEDHFEFAIERTNRPLDRGGPIRFHVIARVSGRVFEQFHIDIILDDFVVGTVEYLRPPEILAFAGIETTVIPCYPITQHIAEKIHAYTKTYASGESSRIKDFIDLLLLAELGAISGSSMMRAIAATFQKQGVQAPPNFLPAPPSKWSQGFRRNAREVGLSEMTLEGTYRALQKFLDPVFDGTTENMTWHPEDWKWE